MFKQLKILIAILKNVKIICIKIYLAFEPGNVDFVCTKNIKNKTYNIILVL